MISTGNYLTQIKLTLLIYLNLELNFRLNSYSLYFRLAHFSAKLTLFILRRSLEYVNVKS